jgi:hypothetical protein
MIKLNFPQKNRAKHGAGISKEKQTLLSKRREKLQSKFSHAIFNHIDWIPHWSVFRTKAHLSNGG